MDDEKNFEKFGRGELDISYEDIEFDLQYTFSNALDTFGELGDENAPRIGLYVKFLGLEKFNDYLSPLEHQEREFINKFKNCIGIIASEHHGRIIIEFDQGFLGWIYPEHFEIVHINDSSNWIH